VNVDRMVFHDGDLVTGRGELVVDGGGCWLDLRRARVLTPPPGTPCRSLYSVRLVGADVTAVPTEHADGGVVPGHITIVGIWRDGVIEVRSQSPLGPGRRATPAWTTPPCPPPAGGWPRGARDANIILDLDALRAGGTMVTVTTFRPGREQAVLVVAAEDPAAAEAILRPQLADRLCVVRSHWTRAEMDAVLAHLRSHSEEWAVSSYGESASESGQPVITVTLVRVTPGIAEWLATIDDGMLDLAPSLLPAA
jgi:hypothetical protein